MSSLSRLAVIVPVAPGDKEWKSLANDLRHRADIAQVLLSGPEELPESELKKHWQQNVRWVRSPLGRARQLNQAAHAAQNEWLWFVHADTRVDAQAIQGLEKSISRSQDAIHYFDLGFFGGPKWMKVNEWGARFRSRALKLPFGDQAFCLRRKTLLDLGGFDESAPFGEDHLLIWQARKAGVPIVRIGNRILTSARKYQERGWARTTFRHMALTAKQAFPHWMELRAQKSRRPAGE